MSDEQIPLDLRALADVDSPEVVRAALRTFRRKMLTRYVWVVIAIVVVTAAFIVGGRPTNLREEMERAHTRSFPEQVWRVGGASIALEEVADLGDDMGLHFIVLPDPGKNAPSLWVDGETYSMGWNTYDTYVKLPKISGDSLQATVGASRCLPNCRQQETFTIDLRRLNVPPNVWRTNA